MSAFLYPAFALIFVVGVIVCAVGVTYLIIDDRRKKVTGHWVEHYHRVLGHWIPWVQPVSSGTAAENIVDICSGFGFECVPGEREIPRAPRHRDSRTLLPTMLGKGKRTATAIRRRVSVPRVRDRKANR